MSTFALGWLGELQSCPEHFVLLDMRWDLLMERPCTCTVFVQGRGRGS